MSGGHGLKPAYPSDAFVGTAEYYARYRLPYPEVLRLDLLARARHRGGGRLLDLACGPGRVSLDLAPAFAEVWAIDREPEMVAMGRVEADRRGFAHFRWLVGRAEDLQAPPGTFDLVTIGDAFHRLDQDEVTALAYRWLKPGGAMATLGSYSLLAGSEPWQLIVAALVRRWTDRESVPGGAPMPPLPGSEPEDAERVLREAGFAEVASHPFTVPYVWEPEAIVGHLFSISICSRRTLGDAADTFADAVKAALLAHDPAGRYAENVRFGYTFGRKPG